MSLKVGDNAVTIKDFVQDNVFFKKGTIGKVLNITDTIVAMQWNFKDSLFHACGNRGRVGYCYYVKKRFLEGFEPKKNNIEGWQCER